MVANRARYPSESSRTGVSWSDGVVRLRDDELFGTRLADLGADFLRHVFALVEVAWVEIDGEQFAAAIRYDSGRLSLPEFLERLSATLRGQLAVDAVMPSAGPIARDLARHIGPHRIERFGSFLTTWEIVHHRPGRLRLRHQALRGDPLQAARVRDAILHVPGVTECTVRPVTGSVLIRFDPDSTNASQLLRILDYARHTPPNTREERSLKSSPAGFKLATSSLVLAVAGETTAPFLLPVCAVLLVGSNLPTFRAALRQLRRGQLGLPVLYTAIVAATLASGQFIASAAMNLMLTFWGRRYAFELTSARRRLLGQIAQQPRFVRLATPAPYDTFVEVLVDDLKTNDVIIVTAGDHIPADGQVKKGQALVDERLVRGIDGLSSKQPDDEVFAGSTVRLGELYVEVLRTGADTQAALLLRSTLATTPLPLESATPSVHGAAFAEPTVAPTMAMASIGLLIGDITMAGAILRPDYATGPGMAFPLEALQAGALCFHHGILIRDPTALDRLALVDLVILDHHAALERALLAVDAIDAFPGYGEDELLRYAATALEEIDDERVAALLDACTARGIELLDVRPAEYATDLTLEYGNDRIKVGDLGPRARGRAKAHEQNGLHRNQSTAPNSLMVGVNGRVAGLIHFRRSERLQAGPALLRLRSRHNLNIGLVSDQPETHAAALRVSLGVDFHAGDLSAHDRVRLLRHCRNRGFKVAYVGDCRIQPRAAALAHVAISLGTCDVNSLAHDPAPICLLQPRISQLDALWEIARVHRQRVTVARGYSLIPNLACVAGAFAWGFTSLASVLVTNLGTYSVYSRTAASIRSLERQIARSPERRSSGARGIS
jgi:cation transport ATPase